MRMRCELAGWLGGLAAVAWSYGAEMKLLGMVGLFAMLTASLSYFIRTRHDNEELDMNAEWEAERRDREEEAELWAQRMADAREYTDFELDDLERDGELDG